jgi:hypothetical protein
MRGKAATRDQPVMSRLDCPPSSSPPRTARGKQSSTLRPADASAVHLSRRVLGDLVLDEQDLDEQDLIGPNWDQPSWDDRMFGDHRSTSTAAGPCDAIIDIKMPKTENGAGYFFFAAFFFAVFFTAFFAAAFVVFRFFAIAALLALSGWRHRCSAVANRAALTIDYYSRKKITVTPLNFVCKPRAPRARRCRGGSADRATLRRTLYLVRSCATFRMQQRSADNMGMCDTRGRAMRKALRAHRARSVGIIARAKTPSTRDFPTRKKIRGERAKTRFAPLHAVQNVRIGVERFA